MLKNTIYIRDEAAKIVDQCEDALVKNDVFVLSPEDDDDDRGIGETGLYGSTYDDILNYVEDRIKAIIKIVQTGDYLIVPDEFSGDY